MGSFMVLFLGLFTVALLVIVASAAGGMLRTARMRLSDQAAPRRSTEARIVEKRTQVTGGGDLRVHQQYFATFEFPDGRRLELELPPVEAGVLVTGDRGILSWQGTRYLGFDRQVMR